MLRLSQCSCLQHGKCWLKPFRHAKCILPHALHAICHLEWLAVACCRMHVRHWNGALLFVASYHQPAASSMDGKSIAAGMLTGSCPMNVQWSRF